MRRFQNADETKSFYAELTGYDEKTKRVTVRNKAGRKQSFSIEILSEDDRTYVKENAKRLAVGESISISLRKFQDKSEKQLEPRIENRVAPSGYTISLNNRSKSSFTNLTLNYTLYYTVQDYLSPERTPKQVSGTLTCEEITSRETVTLKTETIGIVSGKLEPVIKYKTKKNRDGQSYTEPYVDKPGGRRKDQMVGCKIELIIDGEVVKTETEGTIQMEKISEGL